MKTLNLNEMEKVSGGNIFCAASLIGLGAGILGAAAIVTTGGAALFLVAFVTDSIGAAGSC